MIYFQRSRVALLSLFVLFALFPATGIAQRPRDPITAVRAALAGQVNAWNAGDLDGAMALYWNSPNMIWISKSGLETGYRPILDAYRKDFADRTKMGVYTYQPLFIERLSRSCVQYVFRWKIEIGGKRMMGGVSSQVWKRLKGRWVITSEHAS